MPIIDDPELYNHVKEDADELYDKPSEVHTKIYGL
jgi:hypothetical protein